MKRKNKCPCVDCICIPACRAKIYTKLVKDCDLFCDYVSTHEQDLDVDPTDYKRLVKVAMILQPIYWRVIKTTFRGRVAATVLWSKKGIQEHYE